LVTACFRRTRTFSGVAKALVVLVGIMLNYPLALGCVLIGEAR